MAIRSFPWTRAAGFAVSMDLVYDDATGAVTGVAVTNTTDTTYIITLRRPSTGLISTLTFPPGTTTLPISGYILGTKLDSTDIASRVGPEGA